MKAANLAILGLLIIPALTQAATFQVNSRKTIVEIKSYTYGATIIFSPPQTYSLAGCSGSNAKRAVVLKWALPNAKYLYATLLTAFANGKKITFGVTNQCTAGFGGPLPSLYRVDTK